MAVKRKKPQGQTTKGSDKYIIRLPDGMRDTVSKLAAEKGRSMNAEIVAALEAHLENEDTIAILWNKVEALEGKVETLEQVTNDLRRG